MPMRLAFAIVLVILCEFEESAYLESIVFV
jgi:hypothetical protein